MLDLSTKSLTIEYRDARFDSANPSNNPSYALGEAGNNWLKAIITNTKDVTDSITLTLDANLAAESGAFFSSVAFNLAKEASIDSACIVTSAPSECLSLSYTYNPNKINMANGIDGFDLRLNFPLAENERLDFSGSTVSFILTGNKLDFRSFYDYIDIGGVKIFSAARLQGYGGEDEGGGSSTVYSAPGPLPILAVVAAFRASRRLRHRLASGQLASAQLASASPRPTAQSERSAQLAGQTPAVGQEQLAGLIAQRLIQHQSLAGNAGQTGLARGEHLIPVLAPHPLGKTVVASP